MRGPRGALRLVAFTRKLKAPRHGEPRSLLPAPRSPLPALGPRAGPRPARRGRGRRLRGGGPGWTQGPRKPAGQGPRCRRAGTVCRAAGARGPERTFLAEGGGVASTEMGSRPGKPLQSACGLKGPGVSRTPAPRPPGCPSIPLGSPSTFSRLSRQSAPE